MSGIKYIDEVSLSHKRILIRVDFNVSLNPNHTIADDARIKQSIPTLEYLLKRHNKLILIAHLGQPEKRNPADSLKRIAKRLHQYLPHHHILLVDDFLKDTHKITQQKENEILLLENIRFYSGEQENDPEFTEDNFSLEGALTLFKKANNLEEFEKSINEENNDFIKIASYL